MSKTNYRQVYVCKNPECEQFNVEVKHWVWDSELDTYVFLCVDCGSKLEPYTTQKEHLFAIFGSENSSS